MYKYNTYTYNNECLLYTFNLSNLNIFKFVHIKYKAVDKIITKLQFNIILYNRIHYNTIYNIYIL